MNRHSEEVTETFTYGADEHHFANGDPRPEAREWFEVQRAEALQRLTVSPFPVTEPERRTVNQHKANEHKAERLAFEARERADVVAALASMLANRQGREDITPNNARRFVHEARMILEAAHEAEEQPSPFPEPVMQSRSAPAPKEPRE